MQSKKKVAVKSNNSKKAKKPLPKPSSKTKGHQAFFADSTRIGAKGLLIPYVLSVKSGNKINEVVINHTLSAKEIEAIYYLSLKFVPLVHLMSLKSSIAKLQKKELAKNKHGQYALTALGESILLSLQYMKAAPTH